MSLPVVDPPERSGTGSGPSERIGTGTEPVERSDTGAERDVRDTDDSDDGNVPAVVGVLLAAGTSSRFGARNKLLEEVEGVPIVRQAAESLLTSRVDAVTVVLGHDADRVRTVLEGLPVTFVENPRYEEGQATSVGSGVEAVRDRPVRDRADAILFALGDMPFVDPDSVNALIDSYRAGLGDALAAACEGKRGNPALFDARHFEALADVEGDTGGRKILLREGTLVETGDPGVLADVDDPDDLERMS